MLTLLQIPCGYIAEARKIDFKRLAGGIINDRSFVKEKQKLFYTDDEKLTESVFRVVSEDHMHKYKCSEWKRIKFEFDRGVIKEMFDNKPFYLDLPFFKDGIDVTSEFLESLLGPMAKEGLVDDLLYILIRSISNICRIYWNEHTRQIGFGEPVKKVKYLLDLDRSRVKFVAEEATLDDVLNAEIDQGFINPDIGDPTRQFAYTHFIRAHATFKLFQWSKRVLINWKKYNVVATSRGQGKTFLATMIVARELFNPNPGYGGRPFRLIKYFVPDKSNIGEEVMRYLESLIGDMTRKVLPNGMKAIEINKKTYSVKCNVTGNVFSLISLHGFGQTKNELGSSQGEGIAADVAIVDEACRIPDEFWSAFHQRAAFETQNFFLISTINEETPKDHWFYKLLIDGEVSGRADIISHRVTIDDNELLKMGTKTEEEYLRILEDAKNALRMKGDKEFYAKGYCIILEESNVFDTNQYIVPSSDQYQDNDVRILGFDLGKLTDTCGLVLINLNHLQIEEARIVQNAKYGTQLEYAEEYKKKYKNTLVIGDRTGVGEAVSEQDINGIVDAWIKSTGQGELSYNKQHHFYTCNKGKIINTLATVLNNRILGIPNGLVNLIEQLNNFTKMKSGRGDLILYKGKGKKKDDLVLALAYAVVYIYLILGLKSKEEIENFAKESGNSELVSYSDIEDNSNYHNRLY